MFNENEKVMLSSLFEMIAEELLDSNSEEFKEEAGKSVKDKLMELCEARMEVLKDDASESEADAADLKVAEGLFEKLANA